VNILRITKKVIQYNIDRPRETICIAFCEMIDWLSLV